MSFISEVQSVAAFLCEVAEQRGPSRLCTNQLAVTQVAKPEVKNLNHSGWSKVSLIMDSEAAESVAQVGREGVTDRRSTGRSLLICHQGSAVGRPRLSYGTVVCSPLAFSVVHRSLVSSMVELYCLVTGAQHDVTTRELPRSHGQRSCQSGTPERGMRALRTLGRGSGGKTACVMERCSTCARSRRLLESWTRTHSSGS